MKNKNIYEQLDRMVDLINYNNGSYNEDHPGILYEGLIKTTSLGLTKVMLNRWYKSHNIYDSHGKGLEYENVLIRQDNTLAVYVLSFIDDKKIMEDLFKYVNNLGYSVASILSKKINNKWITEKFSKEKLYSFISEYNNMEDLYVILEAKFDIELDEKDWPEKLYHVTRQDVLHKIKKIGITPRTESKKSTHEERVYFANNYKNAKIIYQQFKKDYPNQKFALLEIDPKLVKHLRLFDDPNYKGYGYYALVNIPPNAIKILDENI